MVDVSFSVTNKSKFPGMDGLPSIPDFDVPDPTIIESIYGNVDFSFDLELYLNDEDIIYDIVEITNITKPSYITTSIEPTNVLQFKRNLLVNPFETETFNFSYFQDDTITTTDPLDLNGRIYKWEPPIVRILNEQYIINFDYVDNMFPATILSDSVTIQHKIYWNYIPSLNTFEGYVNR